MAVTTRFVTPLRIAERISTLLDHFARDIERQIGRVDETTHEAKVPRQKLGLAGDEDALHVELHAALAIGVEEIEGLGARNEGQSGIVVAGPRRGNARSAPVRHIARRCRGKNRMYSSGVMSFLDLVQSAVPSVIWLASAPGFSTTLIGTGTCPDCSLTMRSTVQREV